MRIKLIIFILLCNFAATAQSNAGRQFHSSNLENSKAEYQRDKNLKLNESIKYTGSPYLNEEFKTGYLIKIDNSITKDLKLRYNIYSDNIEFMNKETIQVAPSENFTNKVIIGEKTFKYTSYNIKNKTQLGFLEQVVKGDCCLYYQHRVELIEAVTSLSYSNPEPAKFIKQRGQFFIQLSGKTINSVKRKKDLFKQFTNNKKEIEKFVKIEKLSLNKKEDLIKLVQYYNKLNNQTI